MKECPRTYDDCYPNGSNVGAAAGLDAGLRRPEGRKLRRSADFAAAEGGPFASARGASTVTATSERIGAACAILRAMGLHRTVRLDLDAVRRRLHVRARGRKGRAVCVRLLSGRRLDVGGGPLDLGLGCVTALCIGLLALPMVRARLGPRLAWLQAWPVSARLRLPRLSTSVMRRWSTRPRAMRRAGEAVGWRRDGLVCVEASGAQAIR